MNRVKKFSAAAAFITAAFVAASAVYAADNAFQIDELNWSQEDWESIAMTNDDTVETGAVIRKEADEDSEAAGYLYRGAAARVIDKGEEWTLVESGKVTGYVKNEYLMFGDDARGLAAHYGEQGVTANWDDVSVYSDSSADSDVSQTIDSGTALGMIEDGGHWIAVQKDGDTAGYVSEEDVSRVLLVDTAVPADGDDIEDVAVTLTSSDISGSAGSSAESSSDGTGYSAESNYTQSEVSSESTETYSESSYTEYTETAGSQQSADVTYSVAEETGSSQTAYTADKVSDDAQIQALYEAFIEAQNAAMNCTSAEDAQTKAAAATSAWNAYLAACNGTTYASSGTSSSTAASEDTSYGSTVSTGSASEESSTDSGAAAYSDTSSVSETTDTSVAEETSTESSQTSDSSSDAASTENTGSYSGYSDLDLLAAIIWCEAGNQPYDGMVAVGQVVMNRVKSSSFPNTVAEVLNQPGQFTPASSGTLQAALAAGINSTCYSAATDALNGAAPVPGTPLYFNTHSGSYKLGDHYFS